MRQLPEYCESCKKQISTLETCVLPDGTEKRSGEDQTAPVSEKKPYLHVRPPKRVVGVGGEGEPITKVYGNRAGVLALRAQIDAALALE